MHRRAPTACALIVALLAGGCGAVSGPAPISSSDCADLPGGACEELVARLAAGAAAPIRNISLSCRVATCTRAGGGAGDAVITFVDGRTQTRTWSYAGDPNPLPVPVCNGLARDLCQTLVVSMVDEAAPSKRIVAVSVTCTARCDATGGDAATLITFGDGTQVQGGRSWSGGPP